MGATVDGLRQTRRSDSSAYLQVPVSLLAIIGFFPIQLADYCFYLSHPETGKPVLCFHLGMTESFILDHGNPGERELSSAETQQILDQIQVGMLFSRWCFVFCYATVSILSLIF